ERDSEQVAEQFRQKGYRLTDREEDADVILLNTCSVRDQAEQKAIGKMGYLRKLRGAKPQVVLGFLGCMAQSRGEELLRKVPGVDLVIGTQKFHRVVDTVEAIRSGAESRGVVDTDEEAGSQNTIRNHVPARQVSAFVSIMQGCNMHCTFCIVPSTRGAERSRPIDQIVAEVRELAASGVKEVTLLGQIVNLYGRHEFEERDGKTPFVQLIEAVQDVEGIERIRFTSPHPIGFKPDLVEAFGRIPKLCEHVHLPVQSGSNRILKRMHRAYTKEKYLDLIAKIREQAPAAAITTDIIVGFPGETEEDFQETVDLVRQVQFDQAFIFRYSKRRDTPAAEMDGQLDEEEKMRRNQVLLQEIDRTAGEKNHALLGREVEILVEGPSKTNPARMSGRTRQNKIVVFPGDERHHGQLMRVRIESATNYTLYGAPDILG
ncbi:MAG: tRNA (N6-isopentenyl adenosine(37)-C2)-methylthiotransferase MiaB, partial [Verrucomicrobiae bacterium]|nr:tRNA (N6-isopentenyl adenosine(37)-C2)-methylthiotransferase MiaB [Verrucomicrobiae bacterium]